MKISLLLIAILAETIALAQTKLSLVGFSQASTPGIIPEKNRNENGQPGSKVPTASIHYFLYTKTPNKISFIPRELWINGIRYKVKTFKNVNTPVLTPKNDTLITKTRQYILEIIPGEQLQPISKPSYSLNKLIAHNEWLLKYMWNKKTYYAALKKLTVLETEFGQ
jgi:hypothetical protein